MENLKTDYTNAMEDVKFKLDTIDKSITVQDASVLEQKVNLEKLNTDLTKMIKDEETT